MYVAAVTFVDLQDGRRLYHEGDKFPRDGLTVSAERLAELAGRDNRMGYPLITAVPDAVPEKPVEEPVEEKPVKKPTTRKRVSKRAD